MSSELQETLVKILRASGYKTSTVCGDADGHKQIVAFTNGFNGGIIHTEREEIMFIEAKESDDGLRRKLKLNFDLSL